MGYAKVKLLCLAAVNTAWSHIFSTTYIIPILLNPQCRNRNLLRWNIALATVSLIYKQARYDLHVPGRLALRAQSRELL